MTNTQLVVFSPGRLEEVVRVHQGVDNEVHDHKPPGGGRVLTERVPAVDQHGDVMVPVGQQNIGVWQKIGWYLPVKENEFLFSQDNEDSVSKFWNFGDHKHPGPEATHTVSLNEAFQKFGT